MKKYISILLNVMLLTSLLVFGQEKTNQDLNTSQLEIIPNVDSDDSEYDDPRTLEFCFQDDKGRTLCLYHNIRKQKNIDFEDYEVYAEWALKRETIRWVKQEINEVSVIWNYSNGALLKMETTSSNWKTKRGIKVGDPISKVIDIYSPDSNVTYYNFETKEGYVISEKKDPLLFLREDNEGALVYVANLVAEEIMNIRFTQKDGIITKIEIYFST